jgi:hypothetical protein
MGIASHNVTDLGSVSASPAGRTWSRADKFSLSAVIVAGLALLISAVQPIAAAAHYFERPRVSIAFPSTGAHLDDNRFGASGSASHIPPSSDLWLVIRPGIEGRYYPTINLTLNANGSWHVGPDQICPAPGVQDIQVYMVPNTDENDLFGYRRSGAAKKGAGMNSMPAGAVLEASSNVVVAANMHTGC